MGSGEDRARENPKWSGMWVVPDFLILKEPQKRTLRLLAGVILVSVLLMLLLDSAARNGKHGVFPGLSNTPKGAAEGVLRPATEESGLGGVLEGEPKGAWMLENQLSRDLEGILSRIRGVGTVSVRVTVDGDQVREYAIQASGGQPLLHQLRRPAIKGVLVVAEGAGDPLVKDEVVRGVQAALGVPIHLIRVSEGTGMGTEEKPMGVNLPANGGKRE